MAFYEYMKNRVNGETIVPEWVDHGPFLSKSDGTHVTYIPDDRDYWVPDTLVELTNDDIIQRFLDIHNEVPFTNFDMSTRIEENKTEDEVIAMANDFISRHTTE